MAIVNKWQHQKLTRIEKNNHSHLADENVKLYSYSAHSMKMPYKPKPKTQQLHSKLFIPEKLKLMFTEKPVENIHSNFIQNTLKL